MTWMTTPQHMNVSTLHHWFLGLGGKYGVDPVIFGVIYVGAIPFSWASVAWLVRNVRTGRSPVLPALSTAFFFLSVYFYVIPVGHNVPAWVYAAAGVFLVVGAWSTVRSIRAKLNRSAVEKV